jgi:MFS family permease
VSRPVTSGLLIRLFLIFAAGYFLSYLFRTVNAVLSPYLARDLGLDAAALGLLTSAYFIAFAAAQLPLGLLLDRFGPRRVETGLLLLAAVGAALFAVSDGIAGLIAGRALIGLGVSACLMAGFKALVLWFPRDRLPLLNGLFMVSGGLGAIAAATPVQMALTLTDWRGVFLLLAAATILSAAIIFLFIPERAASDAKPPSLPELLRGFGQIFTSPLFLRLAPASGLAQGVFLGYQALWAGAWLRDVNGLDDRTAADIILASAAGMSAGYFLVGLIADRLARLGIAPLNVAVGGIILFVLLQGLLVAGAPLSPWVVWIGFGLLGTSSSASYAVLSQSLPPHLSGRSNTAINLVAFLVAFSVQSLGGTLLDFFGPLPGGRATPEAHRLTLGIMVAVQCAGLLWFWLRRPTRP